MRKKCKQKYIFIRKIKINKINNQLKHLLYKVEYYFYYKIPSNFDHSLKNIRRQMGIF